MSDERKAPNLGQLYEKIGGNLKFSAADMNSMVSKINKPYVKKPDSIEIKTYQQDISENIEKMLIEIQQQRDELQDQREQEKIEFEKKDAQREKEFRTIKKIASWSMFFGGVGGISGLIVVIYTFLS